jgi:hypothetical protein
MAKHRRVFEWSVKRAGYSVTEQELPAKDVMVYADTLCVIPAATE